MTEPKFTKGPWRKCGGATPAYIAVHSARGYIVFGMADSDVHTEGLNKKPIKAPDMWEQQANARLIAAAPQLYDALKEARGWVVLAEDLCRDNSKALALIDAALSAAAGEA